MFFFFIAVYVCVNKHLTAINCVCLVIVCINNFEKNEEVNNKQIKAKKKIQENV